MKTATTDILSATPGRSRWQFRVLALLCAAATQAGVAQQARDDTPSRIDALFATWNSPTSPGCVYGVMNDDKMAYSGAYGMADLARNTRLSTSTVFDVGSIAKQFTAATVAMLAMEGELSLQDDVRRYIPELPDYGTPITIYRHRPPRLRQQRQCTSIPQSSMPMSATTPCRPAMAATS